MSREVRRVPLDWQHPREIDPYAARRRQMIELSRALGGQPVESRPSRLLGPDERFVPLLPRSILAYYEAGEEPRSEDTLMPDWSDRTDLGWCLYETVTEGTPVTPVFATAEELVEYLATVGQDHDDVPYRRAAAEALVRHGSSCGSMVGVPGVGLLDCAKNADLL